MNSVMIVPTKQTPVITTIGFVPQTSRMPKANRLAITFSKRESLDFIGLAEDFGWGVEKANVAASATNISVKPVKRFSQTLRKFQ